MGEQYYSRTREVPVAYSVYMGDVSICLDGDVPPCGLLWYITILRGTPPHVHLTML